MNGGSKGREGEKCTLVEEGTAVTGNMSSTCPIVVMGKIEGEVSGPSMEIAESGVVSGKIKVKQLTSCGELAGELEAETVTLSGRVRDETVIRAQSLEVTSTTGTPVKFGECQLSIGEEPNKQRAIEGATGAARSSRSTPVVKPEPAEATAQPPAPVAPPSDRRRRRNTANSATVDVALEVAESGSVPH